MKEKPEPDIEIAPLLPHDEGAPHINAAPVYGASPGKDFFMPFLCAGRDLCAFP